MSRRVIAIVIAGLLLIGLILAWYFGAFRIAEKKPLKVYSNWSGEEAKNFQKVLDAFTEKTGIEAKNVGVDTQTLKLSTLADYESEFAPGDVVVMPWPARIVSDAKSDHLVALGDLYNPADHVVSADTVTFEGNIYGAPLKVDIKPGFWYRKSFFENHGLSEPNTYEEFLNLLEEISNIEGVTAPLASGAASGWPLSDQVEAFFLRPGADVQQGLLSGEVAFDSPPVKEAFEKVLHLLKEGYFGPPRKFGTAYQYMWDGSTPLYFMGSWTPSFIQGMEEDPTAIDFFPLPGVKAVVGSSNWLTIPKYSKQVEDAKKLVEFLTSAEAQAVWARESGFIGTNKNIPEDAYKLPVMKKISDFAGTVIIVPDLDDGLGDPFQSKFWSQLQLLWANPSEATLDQVIQALNQAQTKTIEGE